MINFKNKIGSKYTPKRTKLHHFKKISRGACPRTPAQHMSLCDMQVSKSEKILGPPSQIVGTSLPRIGACPTFSLENHNYCYTDRQIGGIFATFSAFKPAIVRLVGVFFSPYVMAFLQFYSFCWRPVCLAGAVANVTDSEPM